MVLYKIHRFYYFLHHYICFVLFYCGIFVLFVLLHIAMSCHCSCLCAFVTLNKRLLTYLLTYNSTSTSANSQVLQVGVGYTANHHSPSSLLKQADYGNLKAVNEAFLPQSTFIDEKRAMNADDRPKPNHVQFLNSNTDNLRISWLPFSRPVHKHL